MGYWCPNMSLKCLILAYNVKTFTTFDIKILDGAPGKKKVTKTLDNMSNISPVCQDIQHVMPNNLHSLPSNMSNIINEIKH